jgi:hypothetical protein
MRQGLISLLGTWWRSSQGELEACRRELSESLERETATSQVLGIISSSPTDLEPVFEAILANATRLCEASYGTLWLCEGDALRAVALHGALPAHTRRSGGAERSVPLQMALLPARRGPDGRSRSLTCVPTGATSIATQWQLPRSNWVASGQRSSCRCSSKTRWSA